MIVVTGATGNVGRTLVAELAAAGERVTAVSRRPSDAPRQPGVRHHSADLTAPESLLPALEGADALYLLVAGAGDGTDPGAILDAAKRAGVRRVVLQSSQLAGTRPRSASHDHLREFEAAVRESGAEWTVLRPAGFATNAFAWVPGVREQRTVAAPFGDVGLPVVDPADIAAVAARVLRGAGHTGRTYELTGPAPVTPREQARAIGEALGEPVRFAQLTRDEARAVLSRFMPDVVVEGTLSVLGEPSEAERRVSPDTERVLGRAPGSFAAWAARNREVFA
ncbi:SDR family oxidoreductase [Streptomyces sp. NPDC050504]|uniref:SDR family oxidoreductase n=1 Tax=Streptomyces sp. NPDC050504 TaxID=3365618 RepID=UPI00378CC8EB